MYNKIIIVGRLTKDIEVKNLSNGSQIVNSSIVASHFFNTKEGDKKEEKCFLEFSVFGKTANVARNYLKKGSKVLLEGRLVFQTWTTLENLKRSKHVLYVERLIMLDNNKEKIAKEKIEEKISLPEIDLANF